MKKIRSVSSRRSGFPLLYFRDYSMHYNYELAMYNFK